MIIEFWHRIMQGLPAGQLSFILRGASDTLPTPLNLARWKLRVDSRCPLCSSPSPTTLHILNACPTGWFTWRHDSVLRIFLLFLKSHLSGEGKLLSDLDGFRVSNNRPSTVPPDILDTTAHPDIVFVTEEKEVIVLELTVPFNSPDSISNVHSLKTTKYQLLLSDLEAKSFHPKFLAIEIGALGHSISSFCNLFPKLTKPTVKRLFDEVGKLAITASRRIFLARKELTWNSSQPLLQ